MKRPAWNMLDIVKTNARMTISDRYLRQRVGASLKSSSKERKEGTKLNVRLPTKEVTRPHYKECTNSAAGTEDTIGC
jgi:hypothetical protein